MYTRDAYHESRANSVCYDVQYVAEQQLLHDRGLAVYDHPSLFGPFGCSKYTDFAAATFNFQASDATYHEY